MKYLALVGLSSLFMGCGGVVVVGHPYHRVVVQPAVVVEEPVVIAPQPVVASTPVYVEEGAVVNGVIVAEPVGVDYVLISGGWYYWHPGFNTWVHANRPQNWHPIGHVYRSWNEHPQYRRQH